MSNKGGVMKSLCVYKYCDQQSKDL